MTAFGISKWLLALAIAATSTASTIAEEKPRLARDGLPDKYIERIKSYQDALESIDNSDAAKGIYRSSYLWGPNYPKIRVCFFQGSQPLRDLVATVAKEWMAETNSIKLDFGKPGKRRTCQPGNGKEMQIRVSFKGDDYASLLGQNSVAFAKQEEPSLLLGGFMEGSPDQLDDYKIGTIRHEFGHALGIIHEHQNPKGGCDDEYIWKLIYESLGKPPNNWSKEKVDFNLRAATGEGLQLTKFDNKSVMIYHFPAEFYKKGAKSKCYVAEENSQISASDRELAAIMYPPDVSTGLAAFQHNKERFEAIWNKGRAAGTKGVTFDPIKEFFERAGTKGDPAEED